MKAAKSNKQPGPDGVTMELFKWLDDENRRKILDLINLWWMHEEAPVGLFKARVVPVFKKGDVDNAAN